MCSSGHDQSQSSLESYTNEIDSAGGNMLKPDFTGTWRFNRARSTLQITAPDTTIFVIDHRDPTFRTSRTHVFGETRDTFSLDLTTDGQLVSAVHNDIRLRSRAHWDGYTLVFETSLSREGGEATNVVRYTLSDNAETLVAEECFRSGSMNYDNVWLFDRVEPEYAECLVSRTFGMS